MNIATLNIGVQIFHEILISIPLDIFPEVEFLDHMVAFFWGGVFLMSKKYNNLQVSFPNSDILGVFSGGLVVRILGVHCCGLGSIPG